MGSFVGPESAQDNLALCLDAGNTRSYPGSGTTWFDISGNGKTTTLTNGPTYSSTNGGTIVFDGVNDQVTYPNTTYTLGGIFSIEVWSYWNGASAPDQNPWAGCMYTNSALSDWNGGTGSNSGLLLGFASMRYNNLFGSEIGATWTNPTIKTWHHYVITINNGTGYVYVDGQQVYTATDFRTTFSTTGTYGIGVADVFGSIRGSWNGYISAVRVYVRTALTAAEVRQNFNSLKGRYALY